MEYTTEFDEANGVCTVHVVGPHRPPQDSMILQRLARDLGNEKGCRRFLFDMTRAEISGGVMDAFETGTVPVDPDHKQVGQRIALVYAGNLTSHQFMEDVAVNRGYQLRVFATMDEAVQWLVATRANT